MSFTIEYVHLRVSIYHVSINEGMYNSIRLYKDYLEAYMSLVKEKVAFHTKYTINLLVCYTCRSH